MNEANHGSLPACQRLHAAGIVLETEVYWEEIQHWKEDAINPNNPLLAQWRLCYGKNKQRESNPQYPAPSMAEVARELLNRLGDKKYIRFGLDSKTGYFADIAYTDWKESTKANITDCLIDLLIFVEQRKEERK